jgi:hypothetical protein
LIGKIRNNAQNRKIDFDKFVCKHLHAVRQRFASQFKKGITTDKLPNWLVRDLSIRIADFPTSASARMMRKLFSSDEFLY